MQKKADQFKKIKPDLNIDMDTDYAMNGRNCFFASLYKYILNTVDNSEKTHKFFENINIDENYREMFTNREENVDSKDYNFNYEKNLNTILELLPEHEDLEYTCSKSEFEEFLKKIETYYNQYVQPSKPLKILLNNSNSIINNEEKNTNHAIINIYLPTALLIGFVIKFATELFGERRNNYEYGMVFNFYCYWTNYLDRNWSRNERRHL